MTSWRPYWRNKTILRELNAILMIPFALGINMVAGHASENLILVWCWKRRHSLRSLNCILLYFVGTPRQRMPVAMSESNTPYTPGGTPSINADVDPARLVPQLQQHFPRGIADPKVYSAALAAVARQRQESQKTPTQLTPAQWGAAAAQHIQRQNKQRAQQTPTQETPTQQGYQQFPQYGYYQQHQDQSQTPTYGYQQTYSGKKSSSKEGSKSR